MKTVSGNAPPRFKKLGLWQYGLLLLLFAFCAWSFTVFTDPSYSYYPVWELPVRFVTLIVSMLPPDLGRIAPLSFSLLVTFEMALVGNLFGLPLALAAAFLAARSTSPHPVISAVMRAVAGFIRTMPDIVWAILAVASVGLGPKAGCVTLVISSFGFCARFFTETIEELDRGPKIALAASGASRTGIFFSAVLPQAMPSFINTALFSLEHATRSSAVLGIVGAGGIGIELFVSIRTFRYRESLTVLLLVLLMVVIVERACEYIRKMTK